MGKFWLPRLSHGNPEVRIGFLICISLLLVKLSIFMCSLIIDISSFEKCLFVSVDYLSIGQFIFLTDFQEFFIYSRC